MTPSLTSEASHSGQTVRATGESIATFGLAFVFGAIGLMKFTAYEAEAISGLVQSSPLISWVYGIFSVRAFGTIIGVVEVTAAVLLALRYWSPRAGAVGAALIAATLLLTLTFLFSAPGWEPTLGGFPYLSVLPGQFLLKDLPLLGIALWALGDCLTNLNRTN